MGSRCVGASRARTGGVARVHDPSPWTDSVTPGSGLSPVSVDPDTCRPWSRDAARDSHDLTRSRRLRRRWRPERGTGKMKKTLHHVARAVVVFSSTSFRLARAMTEWPWTLPSRWTCRRAHRIVRRDVHAVAVPARCGLKQTPSRSIAQAMLSRRSATERREPGVSVTAIAQRLILGAAGRDRVRWRREPSDRQRRAGGRERPGGAPRAGSSPNAG